MADDPVDPRIITVLSTLNAADPRTERKELATQIVTALDAHAPPKKDGFAEKAGCAIAFVGGLALMVMALIAAGIGLIWLYQAVL